MNLTRRGLFVLTRAELKPGSQLEIHVPAVEDAPEMMLRAIVVRQRLVAGKSARLISQGVGLRVLQAPEAYYELAERETRSPRALGEYLRRMLSQGLGRTE